MLQLITGNREFTLAEHRLATAAHVPVCSDAVYLLARARFLESVRAERESARAAS